ncbi:MAG: putative glycoside hydrolase [Minisyncoccia bacterium]
MQKVSKKNTRFHSAPYLLAGAVVLFLGGVYFVRARTVLPTLQLRPIVYDTKIPIEKNGNTVEVQPVPVIPAIEHVQTPAGMKSIYMSQCYASMPNLRKKLIAIADTTEVNSIIVDVKDYTGTISHPITGTVLKRGGKGCKVEDMRELVKEMHAHNIYVIGRITVFQDPYMADLRPEWAVKSKSRADGIWRDKKGLAFIDVGAKGYWDYVVELSKQSHALGFDELNYDYIRFPSDGNMKDAVYSHSTEGTKADNLEKFFQYLTRSVRTEAKDPVSGHVPKLSADVFGMVATNSDDLTIGQVLERTVPYFDYTVPMVYPSHYPSGFNGYKNPNLNAYGVIKFSMDKAVARLKSETTTVPGFMHTPVEGQPGVYKKPTYDPKKLRTWIQDFDYGGNYGPKEVREQFQATYDAGLDSWMIWSPSNRYTLEALHKE